jgi:zinc transport system substrate-binding protein
MQMKSAKRHLLFILPAVLSIAGVARGEGTRELRIVTSFYPMYIMAKNVARDVPGVSVRDMVPALTGCLHDYSLTNDDMKKLADAQLLVTNGAGMESFLDKVLTAHPGLKVIELAAGIPLIERGGSVNPHVWGSISNAIIEVQNLGKALAEFDPAHAALYEENAARYAAKLDALRLKMHAELAPYKGRQIITFHEAFAYFAGEFDLIVAAVIEREPGSEPSAKELAGSVELIKKNHICALFSEPQYPAAAAYTIAKETGVAVYVLDPAVTGPDDYDAYLNIMENDLVVLKKAFEK